MLFNELYGTYYKTVAAILTAAVDHPLKVDEMTALIRKYAFAESVLTMERCFREERWPLLKSDGTAVIRHAPTMPLTLLEKRWLAAICRDPRIRLFGDFESAFRDVEPLFLPEDFDVFDRYADGDDFEDENYIRNFRIILNAIQNGTALSVESVNRRGEIMWSNVMPECLEYSEKDDKFRLLGAGKRFGIVLNLGRILSCKPCEAPYNRGLTCHNSKKTRTVIFELIDERRALERVLLHFAHFEKKAERLSENRYRITLSYDKDDETELVIRLLSFGPKIRVVAPNHFIQLIRERLIRQKSCGQ